MATWSDVDSLMAMSQAALESKNGTIDYLKGVISDLQTQIQETAAETRGHISGLTQELQELRASCHKDQQVLGAAKESETPKLETELQERRADIKKVTQQNLQLILKVEEGGVQLEKAKKALKNALVTVQSQKEALAAAERQVAVQSKASKSKSKAKGGAKTQPGCRGDQEEIFAETPSNQVAVERECKDLSPLEENRLSRRLKKQKMDSKTSLDAACRMTEEAEQLASEASAMQAAVDAASRQIEEDKQQLAQEKEKISGALQALLCSVERLGKMDKVKDELKIELKDIRGIAKHFKKNSPNH